MGKVDASPFILPVPDSSSGSLFAPGASLVRVDFFPSSSPKRASRLVLYFSHYFPYDDPGSAEGTFEAVFARLRDYLSSRQLLSFAGERFPLFPEWIFPALEGNYRKAFLGSVDKLSRMSPQTLEDFFVIPLELEFRIPPEKIPSSWFSSDRIPIVQLLDFLRDYEPRFPRRYLSHFEKDLHYFHFPLLFSAMREDFSLSFPPLHIADRVISHSLFYVLDPEPGPKDPPSGLSHWLRSLGEIFRRFASEALGEAHRGPERSHVSLSLEGVLVPTLLYHKPSLVDRLFEFLGSFPGVGSPSGRSIVFQRPDPLSDLPVDGFPIFPLLLSLHTFRLYVERNSGRYSSDLPLEVFLRGELDLVFSLALVRERDLSSLSSYGNTLLGNPTLLPDSWEMCRPLEGEALSVARERVPSALSPYLRLQRELAPLARLVEKKASFEDKLPPLSKVCVQGKSVSPFLPLLPREEDPSSLFRVFSFFSPSSRALLPSFFSGVQDFYLFVCCGASAPSLPREVQRFSLNISPEARSMLVLKTGSGLSIRSYFLLRASEP